MNWSSLPFVVSLLVALPVRAEEAPVIALHPSEIVDATRPDTERFQALVAAEFLRLGVTLATSEEVRSALERRHHTCAESQAEARTACLAELARSVHADRAVLITVAPWAGDRVLLTAQVVSATGSVSQDVPPFTRLRGGAPRDSDEPVRAALSDFVPMLELSVAPEQTAIPPIAATTRANSAAAATTSTDATLPATSTGSLRRVVGFGCAGLSVIGLGIGTWAFVDARAGTQRWVDLLPGGPSAASELAAQRERVHRDQMIAVAGGAVGVASAGAAVFLLLTHGEAAPSARVSVIPTLGGAQVEGRF